MRRLNLAILATVLLCTATAAWAADPAATTVPAPELLEVLASPAPMSVDLPAGTPDPTAKAISPLCPQEPIVSCNECFSFGQWLTYRCTFFCDSNGNPRRVCHPCGSGCDP